MRIRYSVRRTSAIRRALEGSSIGRPVIPAAKKAK